MPGQQVRDTKAHVVGGDLAMAIDADDDLAARLGDAEVQPRRYDAARVINQPQAGARRRVGQHRFARAIVRQAVNNQDFQPLGRVVLGQYRAKAALDIGRLVADRHDDRHQGQCVHAS